MNRNKTISKLRLIDRICLVISVALFVGLLWWSDWDFVTTGRLTAVNYIFMLALKVYLVTEYEKLIEQVETEKSSGHNDD